MREKSVKRLQLLCEIIPPLLNKIDKVSFSKKSSPEKWSKKEIIGHLIDSATHNHQRFVRAQFEEIPTIMYDQNKWNKCNYYQFLDSTHIIHFWTLYNLHLLEIIRRIPGNKLKNEINTGDGIYTIELLIENYVKHTEYHLHQVVSY